MACSRTISNLSNPSSIMELLVISFSYHIPLKKCVLSKANILSLSIVPHKLWLPDPSLGCLSLSGWVSIHQCSLRSVEPELITVATITIIIPLFIHGAQCSRNWAESLAHLILTELANVLLIILPVLDEEISLKC